MFPSLRYRYTPQTPASRTYPRARRTSMDSTHSKDIDNSNLPHVGASASPSEDASRIGRWTEDEHERFLQGLNLYGREWKKVAEKVQTRTPAQVRPPPPAPPQPPRSEATPRSISPRSARTPPSPRATSSPPPRSPSTAGPASPRPRDTCRA